MGGTATDPVSWKRGDAKIKQKRNTRGSVGAEIGPQKAGGPPVLNVIEPISSLPNVRETY